MLRANEIKDNKEFVLNKLSSIERDGYNFEWLKKQLEGSDFFTAPATTKYTGSYEGGLCEHSIHVYNNLVNLCKMYNVKAGGDTLIILGLLHDMSKMNLYTTTIQNKKVYSTEGSKHDSMGSFDWVSVPGYAVKEAKDRFVFGNHEATSAYMVNTFIPLTTEEYVAITHHHAGTHWDSCKDEMGEIFDKYPLAVMLYMADLSAYYCKSNLETPEYLDVPDKEEDFK